MTPFSRHTAAGVAFPKQIELGERDLSSLRENAAAFPRFMAKHARLKLVQALALREIILGEGSKPPSCPVAESSSLPRSQFLSTSSTRPSGSGCYGVDVTLGPAVSRAPLDV